MIEGKVGKQGLTFLSNPKGRTGETEVRLQDGSVQTVRWVRDDQGIWIESANGFSGFDVRKTQNDEGQSEYELLSRKQARVIRGLSFLKAGEGSDASGASQKKKRARVKSQMPGKIVRVLVKAGAEVKKGQSILVMEAMKMENEIKAPQDGVIAEVKVQEGQAVETGAELLSFA